MRDPEAICGKFEARMRARAGLDADHGRIRRILEGDPSVFMEIISGTEETPVPRTRELYVANMLLTAGDSLARRIAAPPTVRDTPTDPTKRSAIARASNSEAVKQYWWRENMMNLEGRQVARWLLAFSECPIVCVPDVQRGIPIFQERDPLTAYPAETHTWRPDPADIVFRYRRTLGDLRARYEAAHKIEGEDWVEVDVLEWMDSTDHVLMCYRDVRQGGWNGKVVRQYALLSAIENRAGCPLFVVPRLITFGARQGAFNQLAGLLAAQARLTILMMMAAERQVFPETYLFGQLISPNIAQGPDGVTQMEKDAKVERLNYNTSFQFLQELDRFERHLRIGGEYPAQLSGETPSTLATGRGNQVLVSATVDAGVQERQEILAAGYKQLIECGVAMAKSGMLGDPKRRVGYTKRTEDAEEASTYVPEKLPVGTTRVEYGLLSAADASSATVMLGQLVGEELMSEDGAREAHPFIQYPQLESKKVKTQRLDKAMLASIEHMAVNVDPMTGKPLLDPRVIGRIKKGIVAGKDIEVAIEEAFPEANAAGEAAPIASPPPPGTPGAAPNAGPPGMQQILSRLYGSGAAPTAIMQNQVPVG